MIRPLVIRGDARALPLADASVDCIVTDPPYGLRELPRAVVETTLREWLTGNRAYVPGGSGGFMSRRWDEFVPPPAAWDEAFRVLKPGGHMVAFAGARTVDLMGMSIRLAGFEYRDTVTMLGWVQAQGFPKSLDVSKAIDKRPGVMQHRAFAAHIAERRAALGLSRADVSERVVGTRTGACWNWEHHQFPEAKWWPTLRDLLGLDPAWGEVVAEAERVVVGRNDRPAGWFTGQNGHDVTTSATEDAARWQGWHTALKPAVEPVILCRKPLAPGLSVASNVLRYGTGGINIAATRVGGRERTKYGLENSTRTQRATYGAPSAAADFDASQGRWPTNLVLVHHPDCAETCEPGCHVAELDAQGGERPSGGSTGGRAPNTGMRGNTFMRERTELSADTGGPSRFYPTFRFEPKADGWERPTIVRDGAGEGRTTLVEGRKSRRCNVCGTRSNGGNGEPSCGHSDWESAPEIAEPRADVLSWPTVKPVDLMRWLVRLVCPPGGTVLDLFAGTGSTGQAVMVEGFRSVLIEKDPDALALIAERLSWPVRIDRDGKFQRLRPEVPAPGQLDLLTFGDSA